MPRLTRKSQAVIINDPIKKYDQFSTRATIAASRIMNHSSARKAVRFFRYCNPRRNLPGIQLWSCTKYFKGTFSSRTTKEGICRLAQSYKDNSLDIIANACFNLPPPVWILIYSMLICFQWQSLLNEKYREVSPVMHFHSLTFARDTSEKKKYN